MDPSKETLLVVAQRRQYEKLAPKIRKFPYGPICRHVRGVRDVNGHPDETPWCRLGELARTHFLAIEKLQSRGLPEVNASRLLRWLESGRRLSQYMQILVSCGVPPPTENCRLLLIASRLQYRALCQKYGLDPKGDLIELIETKEMADLWPRTIPYLVVSARGEGQAEAANWLHQKGHQALTDGSDIARLLG